VNDEYINSHFLKKSVKNIEDDDNDSNNFNFECTSSFCGKLEKDLLINCLLYIFVSENY
jgi:hypothetical protein